jgi:C4-type zinc ribbon domain
VGLAGVHPLGWGDVVLENVRTIELNYWLAFISRLTNVKGFIIGNFYPLRHQRPIANRDLMCWTGLDTPDRLPGLRVLATMIDSMQNLLELQKLEFSAKSDEDAAARIAALRENIPPQILGHYDRLRVRGKKGMAPVVNQVCTGCHMRLPLAVVMNLKRALDIQLCDTCGRYLYLPEASAVPEEDVKPAPAGAAKPPGRRKKSQAKKVAA